MDTDENLNYPPTIPNRVALFILFLTFLAVAVLPVLGAIAVFFLPHF